MRADKKPIFGVIKKFGTIIAYNINRITLT